MKKKKNTNIKKCGNVTIYGRANSGKSSLINRILKIKVQAVSEKPQTTRENINCIYNDEDSQIIFCDTPGLFTPHRRLGSILLKESNAAKLYTDALVYVVDITLPINNSFKSDLETITCPVIIALNKSDLLNEKDIQDKINQYKAICGDNIKVVSVSAKEDTNINLLISQIKEYLYDEEPLYPTDMISDRPASFIYSEIIREKCMRCLEKEIPHSVLIDIVDLNEDDTTLEIYADLYVEKESEKGIVLGKKGSKIKQIISYSENALHGFTHKKVTIDILVKVEKSWRDNSLFLNKHGFTLD